MEQVRVRAVSHDDQSLGELLAHLDAALLVPVDDFHGHAHVQKLAGEVIADLASAHDHDGGRLGAKDPQVPEELGQLIRGGGEVNLVPRPENEVAGGDDGLALPGHGADQHPDPDISVQVRQGKSIQGGVGGKAVFHQLQPPLVGQDLPDGVPRLGGHDGRGHPRPLQRREQLRRSGQQPCPLNHQLPVLPLGVDPHGVGKQAVKFRLTGRVAVPGEEGVAVLQLHTYGGAHLLHRGLVQSQRPEPQTVALGDGGGGISQRVVKIEKYPLIVHGMTSVSQIRPANASGHPHHTTARPVFQLSACSSRLAAP